MKFKYWINYLILSVVLLGNPANSQEQTSPFNQLNQTSTLLAQLQPKLTLSEQERQELEKLRQEKEIRDRVQAEVDRAFSRTTTSLYILLLLIIIFSIVSGLAFWLFYRHLINQIALQNKKELEKEIENILQTEIVDEFHQKSAAFKQEMEKIQSGLDNQLTQMFQQANYNLTKEHDQHGLSEATEHSTWGEIPLENQQLATTSPIDSLTEYPVATTEETVNQNEVFTREEESQPPAENEESPSINDSQPLTAEEYLNLGNNHLDKGRYVEANQCYNDAVKIDRNFPEARYQNARAYALRGNINPAIGNLQWAIDLDPKYKEAAKADSAFAYIRTDEQFKQVIEG